MDQRIRNDRRRNTKKRLFRIKNSNGEWVTQERRKMPDRRMSGIAEAECLGEFAGSDSGLYSLDHDD